MRRTAEPFIRQYTVIFSNFSMVYPESQLIFYELTANKNPQEYRRLSTPFVRGQCTDNQALYFLIFPILHFITVFYDFQPKKCIKGGQNEVFLLRAAFICLRYF